MHIVVDIRIGDATLADILAVLKGIDAKLGALVPKPLEKL